MTPETRRLYARHLVLREIGAEGQERLLATHVGGAAEGDAAAVERAYLTRAGVTVDASAAPLARSERPQALTLVHPAAQAVLDGALAALVQLRAALERDRRS